MTKYQSAPERLFSALGDPTRVAVVQRLCRGPQSVSELARPFKMALPTFMGHLRVLERSGWISSQKQGRVRQCRIQPQALQATAGWLLQQRAVWEQRLDQLDSMLYDLKAKEEKQR